MSKTVNLTPEDIVAFATNLRLSLEKIKLETQDGNIRDYVDYLLRDDRHVNEE